MGKQAEAEWSETDFPTVPDVLRQQAADAVDCARARLITCPLYGGGVSNRGNGFVPVQLVRGLVCTFRGDEQQGY